MSQCIHQSLCSFLVDISEKHMGANLVEMANNRFTDASSTTCLYSEVLHEGGEVLLTCQNNNLVLQDHKTKGKGRLRSLPNTFARSGIHPI